MKARLPDPGGCPRVHPRTCVLDKTVSDLGSRSQTDTTWISRVAGCTAGQAKRVTVGMGRSRGDCSGPRRQHHADRAGMLRPVPRSCRPPRSGQAARTNSLVESGAASGVSSAFMLLACEQTRKEPRTPSISPYRGPNVEGRSPGQSGAGMTSGWAVPASLKRGWDLRQGRSEVLLKPLLKEIRTLDFYCHESPVDHARFEFEMRTIGEHLGPGSLVVVDNTDRSAFDRAANRSGASPEPVPRRVHGDHPYP